MGKGSFYFKTISALAVAYCPCSVFHFHHNDPEGFSPYLFAHHSIDALLLNRVQTVQGLNSDLLQAKVHPAGDLLHLHARDYLRLLLFGGLVHGQVPFHVQPLDLSSTHLSDEFHHL